MGGKKAFVAILQGALIGACGIIPGASGGILAVAFGVYHSILNAVASLLKSFKASFMYLLPYGIGVLIGLLGAARVLEWLLEIWYVPLVYLLMGMVLGGVPSLIRDAGERLSGKYIVCVLLGAAAVALLAYLEERVTGGASLPLNAVTAMLSGAVIAVGTVIPGLSISFLLMHLGIYQPLLSALNGFDIGVLFFTGLGALIAGLLTIKLVRSFFRRHPAACSYTILGFLLGTMRLIFPGFAPMPDMLMYILLAAAGFAAATALNRLGSSDG